MNTPAPSKLRDWLSRENIPSYVFAERVDMHRNTISRLLTGKKRPSDAAKERIFLATVGEVSPNDWVLSASDLTKVKAYCCGKSTPQVYSDDKDAPADCVPDDED